MNTQTEQIEVDEKMIMASFGDASDNAFNENRMIIAFNNEDEFVEAQRKVWNESNHEKNLIQMSFSQAYGAVGKARMIDIINSAKPASQQNNYELFMSDDEDDDAKSVGVFELYKDADTEGGYQTLSSGFYFIKATKDRVNIQPREL